MTAENTCMHAGGLYVYDLPWIYGGGEKQSNKEGRERKKTAEVITGRETE